MTQLSASKQERARVRESQNEVVPGQGLVVSMESSLLFAQYFADDGGEGGYTSQRPSQAGQADIATIDALSEQLELRLNGVFQWPLHAAIYLPRLGRINVSAKHENQSWEIDLEAEEERSSIWLTGSRQACQDRLSKGLGQPVSLQVAQVNPA